MMSAPPGSVPARALGHRMAGAGLNLPSRARPRVITEDRRPLLARRARGRAVTVTAPADTPPRLAAQPAREGVPGGLLGAAAAACQAAARSGPAEGSLRHAAGDRHGRDHSRHGAFHAQAPHGPRPRRPKTAAQDTRPKTAAAAPSRPLARLKQTDAAATRAHRTRPRSFSRAHSHRALPPRGPTPTDHAADSSAQRRGTASPESTTPRAPQRPEPR